MPRHPTASETVTGMAGGVFSRLAHRIAALEGEVYPLHVGDTWLTPAEGARMEDLREAELPGLHRYTRPMGHPTLVAALAERRGVDPGRILVSAGATGGLGAAAGALLDPGDEVLVLAPFWPLIPGIVRTARGVPVQVPFYDRPGTVAERLAPHVTDRTVALYLNTPSNPAGTVLDADTLAALADFARAHGLWIWSDEVYEDYAYTRPHVPMVPFAPERTLTAHSFSKAYGMAGNRCGYIVGPTAPAVMQQLRKVSIHAFYSCATASQLAAARVLDCGGPWLAEAHAAYRAAGEAAAARLGLPAPEGGTFLFVDVSAHLDDTGLHGFLVRCIDRNLVLAPGSSCGADYGGFVRLCFTSASPDVVARGVDVLADLLGR
jgi:N-succinyldiaminopimelate aminotransferase